MSKCDTPVVNLPWKPTLFLNPVSSIVIEADEGQDSGWSTRKTKLILHVLVTARWSTSGHDGFRGRILTYVPGLRKWGWQKSHPRFGVSGDGTCEGFDVMRKIVDVGALLESKLEPYIVGFSFG